MKTYYLTGHIPDMSYNAATKWAERQAPAYVYPTGQGLFSVATLSNKPVQPGQEPFIMHTQEGANGVFFEADLDHPDDGSRDGGDWAEGDF